MYNKAQARIFADKIAPDPSTHMLWMDLSADPNGSIIKYWTGTEYLAMTGGPGENISELKDYIDAMDNNTLSMAIQYVNNNSIVDSDYVHTDNNYIDADKNKLAGIAVGAEKNVNADWNSTSGDSLILNKPTIPTSLSSLSSDSTHRLVTDADKADWNSKSPSSHNHSLLSLSERNYDSLTNKPNLSLLEDVIDIQFFSDTEPEIFEDGDIFYSTVNNELYSFNNVVGWVSIDFQWKIYVNNDNSSEHYGKLYVHSGIGLTLVPDALSLGETSGTAFDGERGLFAYSHSLSAGNVHGLTKDDIDLSNVDNTSDVDKPISDAVFFALDAKSNNGHTHALDELSNVIGSDTSVSNTDVILKSDGSTWKRVSWENTKSTLSNDFRYKTEVGDAHGWVSPPNSSNFTISNVGSDVTLTVLSGAGQFKINGTTYSARQMTIGFIANVGQNFVSCMISSGLPSLYVSSTPFDILDLTKIPVCTIMFDGVNVRLGDELHLSSRNLIEHKKQHDTDGARWVSGGATTFASGSTNTFSFNSITIRDEERYHTINGGSTAQILYRNSSGTAMIQNTPSSSFCKLGGVGGTRPLYDNGTGTPVELGNGLYGIMWMYATNAKNPTGGEIVFVMGQGSYQNLSAAQNASQPFISGSSVVEWKLMYRVIVRQVGSALSYVQADDMRTTTTGPSVSGSSIATIAASQVTETSYSNVQTAIDRLKTTQIQNVTLSSASWSLVSGYYEYTYSNSLILSTSIVDAIPDNDSIDIIKTAQMLPKTVSSNGSVKFYSKNAPTSNIIVTINIHE